MEELYAGGGWGWPLLAGHPDTPEELLLRLATEEAPGVREVLVLRELPESVQLVLATDEAPQVQRGLLASPWLTERALEQLSRGCVDTRSLIARHRGPSCPHLPTLLADPEPRVRAALAHNEQLPLDLCLALLADPEPHVVAAAARNPVLPPSRLVGLAEHPSPEVHQGVAENPSAPPDLLLQLVRRGVYRALGNPSFPRETMDLVVQEADEGLPFLARNPSLPESLAARLARSHDEHVRENLAANKETPPALLRRLAGDPMIHVRKAAIRNPSCPREALEHAACEDVDRGVREAAERALWRRDRLGPKPSS
jgi:hypothetical protein